MFYKYDQVNDLWLSGNKISFPDGITLDKNNKIKKDGWFFSEEPPVDFIDWTEKTEENLKS